MKKGFIIFMAIGMLAAACNTKKNSIEWVESTPAVKWQTKQIIMTVNKPSPDSAISIYPERKQQTIDGFGGCFNELGWDALNQVSEEKRVEIMQSLFDTLSGCRFNLCRMPIGANDYAVDWYSHNETADDFNMASFSIDRDKHRLIPYIKEAQRYKPDLLIWASPWCPPSWMKTNHHYACRPAEVNDLPEEGRGQEMVNQFIMEEPYLNAYALYFSKFIEAYREEGIEISAVHVQNEPNSCQNFPSCIWTPSGLATFIGKYLGPRLEADQPGVDIWLGTIERPQIERIDTVLNDTDAGKYIKGIGFQWAGKEAIPQVKEKYQGYKLMQTETECGDGSNDWKAAEHTFGLMKHYFNNGANAYMYWNMILNETGKSQWGWKQNSMISIDSLTKAVIYHPEFYLMKHFSHYIQPGSYKVESSDPGCLAFKTEEGLVVIYYNQGAKASRSFVIGDSHFHVELNEQSFNTFFINEIQ